MQLWMEMANVRKTTGFTRGEITGLRDDLINLSKILPTSAIDLAKCTSNGDPIFQIVITESSDEESDFFDGILFSQFS